MPRVSGHVALVQRKRGAQWYARWRWPDGRPAQRRLGPAWQGTGRPPAGYYTRRTAEEALAALLTDVRRGTLARPERTGATFGDACAEWLRWLADDRKRRPSYLRDCRWAVDGVLLPAFGAEMPLEAVTAARVDAWRAELVAEGRLSPRSVNKYLTLLNGIWRRAARVWGVANPVAGVERQPVRASGDFNVLQPDEVARLAAAAEEPQDAALWTVAAFSGLRLGELAALRWGDIDWGRRLIHVRRSYVAGHEGPPKSGKVRSVPLLDQAAAALDGLSRRAYFTDDDDLVFCGPAGERLDRDAMRVRFRAALAKAGLKPLRFHDLRHSFGTLAVQAYPITDVQAWMGHSSITTTQGYIHHVPRAEAADRLSQLVAAYQAGGANRVAERVAN